jgi:hypothetical protein
VVALRGERKVFKKRGEDSSFSEEKEAKRLLFLVLFMELCKMGSWRCGAGCSSMPSSVGDGSLDDGRQ